MAFRKKTKKGGWKRAERTNPFIEAANRKVELLPGSSQQEAIWDRLVNGKRNLVVEALAGTGKTFTVIQGLARLDLFEVGRVAFVAFNKAIATELVRKVPLGVEASTMHSLLFRTVQNTYGRVKVDDWKTSQIMEHLMGERAYKAADVTFKVGVEKLVSLCKNTLMGVDELDGSFRSPSEADLEYLVERYDVSLNGGRQRAFELVPEILDVSRDESSMSVIDFDDMIWLPIVNQLAMPKFGLLCVDEGQDLNQCQQAAVLAMGQRVMLVGDENQAIYGFRGADTESMSRMREHLSHSKDGVEVLPLTQTRRCPKLHVRLAAEIVPTFEAMPDAPDGLLEEKTLEQAVSEMRPGDLVLCRTNAPVVSMAFRLIRSGVPANIQGRDVGKGLKALINKLRPGKGKGSVKVLLQKLEVYERMEVQKLQALRRVPETRIQALQDKVACLLAFCDGADDVDKVNNRIDTMFTEVSSESGDSRFVLLSSVHRAKGLEADTVWILRPELMPLPRATLDWEKKQEWNIRYVALTRSKRRLVFVREVQPEKE